MRSSSAPETSIRMVSGGPVRRGGAFLGSGDALVRARLEGALLQS